DDWNSVGMALISGRPISFQMDLYQPLYVPRPMVELELFQSLRPVAYESGKEHYRAPVVSAGAEPAQAGKPAGAGFGRGGSTREKADKNADAMYYALEAKQAGAKLSDELDRRMELNKGVQSAATASQLGDFFQYVINAPVTLPRQKSALLPIVNKEID